LLERLVDTPVRGLVYEGAGSVAPGLLADGAAAVRAAGERWRMLVVVTTADRSDHDVWLSDMQAAVATLLEM
jgi:hypothetical protein